MVTKVLKDLVMMLTADSKKQALSLNHSLKTEWGNAISKI